MRNTQCRFKIIYTALFSACLLSGCATTNKQNTYYWGSYEKLLYQMYAEPGTAEPDIQIEKIQTDIQDARRVNRKVPPGVYAHLGFMYAESGNVDLAIDAFNQEKALFPDSTKLIDGMMNRALKGNKS